MNVADSRPLGSECLPTQALAEQSFFTSSLMRASVALAFADEGESTAATDYATPSARAPADEREDTADPQQSHEAYIDEPYVLGPLEA